MAKTLLIGCGGTGIKALMSFNKQMAGDTERRYRMWEDVSYLVIDTDSTDIEKFKSGISDGMENVGGRNIRPVVETVHITRSNDLLNDLVNKYIRKQKDEDVLSRLRENWWFNPDGEPYTAIHRRDTGDGAAQCPPISYFFMWDYLPKLEAVINRLLDKIAARNSEDASPLSDLRVYMVAGMSGGTGRGTWNLVAFKVRECILRRIPTARVDLPVIFLDSSCYAALTPKSPEKNLAKRVNSLTGFSELSAWLAIRDEKDCYSYTLPELVEPEKVKLHSAISGMTDVVHVDSSSKDPYVQSPVRYAYLVFGDNGRQKLYVGKDRNEYCNMVGVALYALVAHAKQFDGDKCNGFPKYCSLSAVSAEVETVELRKFFNSELRRVKINGVREAVSEEERDSYLQVLSGDFKLRQTVTVDENYIDSLSGVENDDCDFVGLLINRIQTSNGVLDAEKLKNNIFAEQKYSSVKKQLQQILKLAKTSPTKVRQTIDDLIDRWCATIKMPTVHSEDGEASAVSSFEKKMLVSPLSRYLWKLVSKAYQYQETPSIARAILCVEQLLTAIGEAKGNVAEIDDGTGTLFKNCEDWSRNQGFIEGWKLFPDPYNAQEKADLTTQLIQVYGNCIYCNIRQAVVDLLDEAETILKKWHSGLKALDKCLEVAAKKFEDLGNSTCVGNSMQSAYSRLFINTDMDAIDASIPTGDVTAATVRRIFKPIMSRKDIAELLADENLFFVSKTKIDAGIKDSLCKMLATKTGMPTDEDIAVQTANMESLFASNVSVLTGQLDAKFTLEEVLRRNVVHWNRKLDDAHKKGLDVERELQDRFRSYLGLRDDKGESGKYDYIVSETGAPHMLLEREPGEDGAGPAGVKNRLPVSLVINCVPWMLFDRDKERLGVANLQKTVLLPYTLPMSAKSKIESEIYKGELVVGVIDPSEVSGRYNPADRVVAFSSFYVPIEDADHSVLDHLASLRSDLADPEVLGRVSLAESSESLGYFQRNPNYEKEKKAGKNPSKYIERFVGLGFASHVIINNPELANRRWRPWQTAVDEAEEKARNDNFVYEVLAYAFTCSGMASNSRELAEITSEGWAFPLLQRSSKAKTKKSGKFVLVRKALGVPAGEVCEWEAGDMLPCTGITQVVNWLMGQGVPDANGVADSRITAQGLAVFKRIAAEKHYFEENILPKFKPSFWKGIVKNRTEWLAAEASTTTKILDSDRETWKKLLAVAASMTK